MLNSGDLSRIIRSLTTHACRKATWSSPVFMQKIQSRPMLVSTAANTASLPLTRVASPLHQCRSRTEVRVAGRSDCRVQPLGQRPTSPAAFSAWRGVAWRDLLEAAHLKDGRRRVTGARRDTSRAGSGLRSANTCVCECTMVEMIVGGGKGGSTSTPLTLCLEEIGDLSRETR